MEGSGVVEAVGDETATLNANHALAGVVLHFDVEIADVREATEEELKTLALFYSGIAKKHAVSTEEAIAAFEEYARRHPTGSDWSAAQQGIVDSEKGWGGGFELRPEAAQLYERPT